MIWFKYLLKWKFLVFFICIILFFLPFFWLGSNELELGGDSSRLYLFDPFSYLQTNSLYSVESFGLGSVGTHQDYIPFLLLLNLGYFLFKSSYLLICILNGIKLAGAFLFTYLIIRQILSNHIDEKRKYVGELASILGGFFYAFSPSVGKNMQTALISHNLVFLNPLIVYLTLRFFITQRNIYLWLALLTTLLFSPNFSVISGVIAVSSFYPLVLLFLVLYVTLFLKKTIPWKKTLQGIILFLGIHAFQIIPGILYVFDPGSFYNTRIFNTVSIQQEGIQYFNAILPNAMVTRGFFYSYELPFAQWALFVGPLVIILGFLLSGKKQKDYLLIVMFFFITTFLFSANITEIGVNFYRILFYIPGFTMFRNFSGQWQWTQAFFYALLFGYSLFLILSKFKKKLVYIAVLGLLCLLVFSSWSFLSGKIFRQPHRTTDNVSQIIEMDPAYEEILSFFKNNPIDGKVFDFPFTEFGYQVVPGKNKGAYIGVSPISFLTDKRDFAGHQILYPFSDTFLDLIKKKDYNSIKRLFGILNIGFIFLNTDARAYNEYFPNIPYTLLIKILPDSKILTDFVGKISDGKIFQSGSYIIFNLDRKTYLPHFYIPTTLVPYGEKNDWMGQNTSFFVGTSENDPRIAYLKKEICKEVLLDPCEIYKAKKVRNIPSIQYMRINPTKYKVILSGITEPFNLIFSDQYNKAWKAFISPKTTQQQIVQAGYFDGEIKESYHKNVFINDKIFETLGMQSIPEKKHFQVNGYANAWYISKNDVNGKNEVELIIEMTQQRWFYYSSVISLLSLVIFLFWGVKMIVGSRVKIKA